MIEYASVRNSRQYENNGMARLLILRTSFATTVTQMWVVVKSPHPDARCLLCKGIIEGTQWRPLNRYAPNRNDRICNRCMYLIPD